VAEISEEAARDLDDALTAVAVHLSRQIAIMVANLNRPSPFANRAR
jgi:hypothetical protein